MTPFTGDKPQRNDRTTFSSRVDAFITWLLDTFWDELQTVVLAFNFNATNSTSTTSLTIGTGSNKTLTVQTGKSYVEGMTVKIANTASPTNWMLGDVISYDSGTGTLVVYPRTSNGSGTFAAWTISQSPTTDAVGDHAVWVHSGNGYGSTNTKIRRHTTVKKNVGTAITYADSATNGETYTINEGGLYEIQCCDRYTVSSNDCFFGFTLNSVSLTTNIQSDASRVAMAYVKDNVYAPITRTVSLVAGDVIRMHNGQGASFMPNGSGQDDCFFHIRKISNG